MLKQGNSPLSRRKALPVMVLVECLMLAKVNRETQPMQSIGKSCVSLTDGPRPFLEAKRGEQPSRHLIATGLTDQKSQ